MELSRVPLACESVLRAGGSAPPDTPEQACMMAQPVTDIVETDGMGELRVEQRHHMARCGERPRPGFDPVLARQLGDQVAGNKVANLRENTEFRPGG